MSCRYFIDGSYSCTVAQTIEPFSPSCKPGSQNLSLPYIGRDNCKDACSYYSYMNSCPEMMTGDPNKKNGTCNCPKETKCKPGYQNLPLPYIGRNNCKDACSYYAYTNSCPVMMTGNPNKKKGTCNCPASK